MTNERAEGVRLAHPLFQAGGGGETPTSALQLWVSVIGLDEAVGLNRLWHSRLPRIDKRVADWLCFGAEHGGLWYAAAIWSLPIARMLPQDGSWLELRRLAVAPDAPRNTPSRLLSVMARLVRRLRPHVVRLISYQDTEVHTGTIYRAAGWRQTVLSVGDTWTRAARLRPTAQSEAPKQRWEKVLRPSPAPAPAAVVPRSPEPSLFEGCE